jgi:hypothetical protein
MQKRFVIFIAIVVFLCLSINAYAFDSILAVTTYDQQIIDSEVSTNVYLEDPLIFIAWVETVNGIAEARGDLNYNTIVYVSLGSYPSNAVTGFKQQYGDAGSGGQTVTVSLYVKADCYSGGSNYATAVVGATY